PARIAKGGLTPTVVWPSVAQSRILLREVPWKLALGRSGFLPHFGLLALFGLAYVLSQQLHTHTGLVVSAVILTTLFIGSVYALIGGVMRKPLVLPVAFVAALITVGLPIGGSVLLNVALERLGRAPSVAILGLSTLALDVFAGAFVFGGYLA